MPLVRCSRCNVVTAVSDECGDFIHECNSGKPALDTDSILRLDSNDAIKETITTSNSPLQGLANKANIQARIDGNHIYTYNNHGKPKQTNYQRQHYEFMEVPRQEVRVI